MKYYQIIALLLITITNSFAQIEVHVLDVGAGHATILELENNKWGIYDAGGAHKDKGKTFKSKISKLIPKGDSIEFMVLSHTDADHIYAAKYVLEKYYVKKIITTGYTKNNIGNNHNSYWNRLLRKIEKVESKKNTQVINLNKEKRNISTQDNFYVGQSYFEFLSGFHQPLPNWNLSEAKSVNAVSIIMKLTYMNKSILFTGDAVGRKIGSNNSNLIATDKFLAENKKDELNVDVVIAPHHGADNGSSKKFCELTTPKYVIFPAGNTYGHPTKQTADRYHLFGGTSYQNIFRTDRGEGWVNSSEYNNYINAKYNDVREWAGQAQKNYKDKIGDDDIYIRISKASMLEVDYYSKE
ncbi:MBL fold metallo-hydrolase [Flammeovirga yaeyamensis]|uniref:MBL fold metallo-hydrolase n=1 Tax=Flammeovirga yaeyamensis TaxID=367791 RepID=A0AAX1MZJ9_9BACT|nr:MBL fold metallo-hydrolase [Flammeovirga yaeyamensis]MBB3695972.1 beta-lactamase superfamily II metal-dependent hydrolase [Flammeovirga yaeyamensis]NMF34659.1 MBL fold metallo-hydrolase [Flammeovirga yaeyamensis]QWG00512.1 MBL fold metallo-hydrolase [Flammeovirga yaeyamensis]